MATGGPMGIGSIDLGIQVEGLPQAARVLKDVQAAAKAFKIDSKLVKRMVDGQKAGNAEMQKLLARASGVMDPKGIANAFKKADKEFADLLSKWQDAHKKSDVAAAKEIEKKMAGLDARLGKELKAQERIIKRREDSEADIIKAWEGLADDFTDQLGDNLEGLFGKLKGGDIKGLFEGGGKMFAKGAKGIGGKMAAGGAEGSAMAKVGGGLAKLGAAAGALAAAAGILAVVVKTMIDAEAQAKEFSKALMEGAGASDLALQGVSFSAIGVQRELGAMRKASLDLAWQFRELPKDMMNILQSANQAGLTFKEMRQDLNLGTDAAYAYSEVMRVAMVYSKNLGMSTSEIAEQTAKWHHDFGMGLNQIEESFAAISLVAMQAGISAKRFTTMVAGATSGMAIYNNRVEEAAGLLVQLTDILGEDLGEGLAQSLTKGFADEGMQDRMKRVMIAGGKDTGAIFARTAEDSLRNMGRLMDGKDEAQGILKNRAGITREDLEEGKGSEKLAALDPKAQRQLITELRGTDPELARQMETLIKVSKGAEGGFGDKVKGLGSLDMGGKLAMMLQNLGDQSLNDMDVAQLAAFEQYSGVAGDQLEALMRVDGAIRGNFEELTRLAESGQKFTVGEQKKQVEQFGAYINDSGEVIRSSIDESANGFVEGNREVANLGDYIQSQGDMLADAVQTGMPAQEAIATRIAENTTSIATLLEVGIQSVLEQIYQLLSVFLGKDDTDEAAIEKSRNAQKDAGTQLSKVRQEMRELQTRADSADPGEAKEKAKLELAAKEQEAGKLRGKISLEGQRQTDLYKGGSGELGTEALERLVRQSHGDKAEGLIGAANAPVKAAMRNVTAVTADSYSGNMAGGKSVSSNPAGIKEAEGHYEDEKAKRDEKLRELLEPDIQTDAQKKALEHLESQVGEQVKQGKDLVSKRVEDTKEGTVKGLAEFNAKKLVNASGLQGEEANAAMRALLGETAGITSPLAKKLDTMRSGAKGSKGATANFNALAGGFHEMGAGGVKFAPDVEDFIYRGGAGGGVITPINAGDELLGGKAGGPLSSKMGGGGVNINIYGGDTQAVYRTVRKALDASGRR